MNVRLRTILAFMIMLALVLSPGAALAKKKRKRKRKKKVETRHYALNEDAVEALAANDYPLAIQLLEESLSIAELNITYLNLGRAYAKSKRCTKALQMYDRMAVAPRVEEPPPEVIFEVLTKYRAELLDQCPGKIRIRCNPSTLQISVDGGTPEGCPTTPLELSPGEHHFEAYSEGKLVSSQQTNLEGMSTAYVDLIAPQIIKVNPDTGSQSNTLEILSWSAIGTGTGLLIMAAIIDGAFIAPDVEQSQTLRFSANDAQVFADALDTKQTINSVIIIGGGALLATGFGLLIYDLTSGNKADNDGVSAFVGPTSGGVTYQLTF